MTLSKILMLPLQGNKQLPTNHDPAANIVVTDGLGHRYLARGIPQVTERDFSTDMPFWNVGIRKVFL